MKSSLSQDAVSALAVSALANYTWQGEGHTSMTDFRDPDDIAAEIASEADPNLGDTVSFEVGFNFGLQLGARIAADPLNRPTVEDLVKIAHARLRRHKETDKELALA